MNNKFEQLHKIIVKLMRKFKVPGLAISILYNDNIVYMKGFGARNLEENDPMTPDTLIGIGSISKSFTALLILKEKSCAGAYPVSKSLNCVRTPAT